MGQQWLEGGGGGGTEGNRIDPNRDSHRKYKSPKEFQFL